MLVSMIFFVLYRRRSIKTTLGDGILILEGFSRPGIALIVNVERDDKMKPIGGQIQDITRLQYGFVDLRLRKGSIFRIIRGGGVVVSNVSHDRRPIDSRVSSTGMTLRIQFHVKTLIGMRQYISTLASHECNKITAAVVMRFGNDALHTKSTIDAPMFFGMNHGQ